MSLDDERARFWRAIEANSDRISAMESAVHNTVAKAVKDAMPTALMTDDMHDWVAGAMKAQAERAAFRKAVIEKSLTGLIWFVIVGCGIIVREYAIAHGMWKP